MDIANIPRLGTVVLTGLDFSMKPEHARYEADNSFIKPFPEIKIMHQIKSLAVMVYNQEKLTPYYHGNVCDGRNTLAYFICAMHRQQAPQPKSHSRQNSISSNGSNSSSSSCKSTGNRKNCELPKLVTTSMLPLGYWDSLYYALVAEIRQLHSDLQYRFGFDCENATAPLHHFGPDGTTNQPITAVDFASMLETAWYTLMDNRLVSALDDAVRMRRMRESAAKQQVTASSTVSTDGASERPPVIYGLMDVNALCPEVIMSMLWDKHAPEINRACTENFEDESMLTAYRAELHAKQVAEGLAVSTPLTNAACRCHRTCVCKLSCEQGTDHCTCNNRTQVYHFIHEQENAKAEIHGRYVKQDTNIPNHFLGASSNTLAQMQIAAMANSDPVLVQACRRIAEADNLYEREVVSRAGSRKRADTTNSGLAYVPNSKALRQPKDAYPLGFYGRDSGQRYPTLLANLPLRRPVPPPTTTNSTALGYQANGIDGVTPPSSPLSHIQAQKSGPVSYPAIPVSLSQNAFTQSFPGSTAGDASANDPAEDYIGLLSHHPSSFGHEAQAPEPFPDIGHSLTTSPPNVKKMTSTMPTLKSFDSKINKPCPTLLQPDFIAPRPAIRQRYVSAGGTMKLSDREEIPGPAFTSAGEPSGIDVAKNEIETRVKDPVWVKKHFGDAAVALMDNLTTPPCGSHESSKRNSNRASGRNSDESEREQSGEKRDRNSSGASKTAAKLRRVFSRKNSMGDA